MTKIIKKISLILIAIFLLTSCAPSSSEEKIRIIDSRISEGKLIISMTKMLIEENTDIKVEILDEMSAVNSYNEILRGNADVFNTYDGTVLTTFLHYDVEDVPATLSIYEFVNEKLSENNLELLNKLGNNNTYAIAITPEVMEKYNINTISELSDIAPKLVFGAEHDFFTEEGNIKFGPFSQEYNLKFKDTYRVDLGLKYAALSSEEMDVTVVFTTDGLNLSTNLTILEDDKSFFSDYYGALMVRSEIFEKYGEDLKNVMNLLENLLPNEEMTKLTYAVDIEMRDIDEVAKEFLIKNNLLK